MLTPNVGMGGTNEIQCMHVAILCFVMLIVCVSAECVCGYVTYNMDTRVTTANKGLLFCGTIRKMSILIGTNTDYKWKPYKT